MKKIIYILYYTLIFLLIFNIINIYGQTIQKPINIKEIPGRGLNVIKSNNNVYIGLDSLNDLVKIEKYKLQLKDYTILLICVDPDSGNDSNDGYNFVRAKKTLQSALDALPKNLNSYEAYIFLHPGTYDGGNKPAAIIDNRNGSIKFKILSTHLNNYNFNLPGDTLKVWHDPDNNKYRNRILGLSYHNETPQKLIRSDTTVIFTASNCTDPVFLSSWSQDKSLNIYFYSDLLGYRWDYPSINRAYQYVFKPGTLTNGNTVVFQHLNTLNINHPFIFDITNANNSARGIVYDDINLGHSAGVKFINNSSQIKNIQLTTSYWEPLLIFINLNRNFSYDNTWYPSNGWDPKYPLDAPGVQTVINGVRNLFTVDNGGPNLVGFNNMIYNQGLLPDANPPTGTFYSNSNGFNLSYNPTKLVPKLSNVSGTYTMTNTVTGITTNSNGDPYKSIAGKNMLKVLHTNLAESYLDTNSVNFSIDETNKALKGVFKTRSGYTYTRYWFDSVTNIATWSRTNTNKIYPTTITSSIHLGNSNGDTTGTAKLNVYDNLYVKGKVIADSGLVVNWYEPNGVIFDGIDDYYGIADNDNLDFGTNDFSIEWYGYIAPQSFSTKFLLAKRQDSNNEWFIVLNYNGTFSITILKNGSHFFSAYTNTVINNGKYNHIVISAKRSEGYKFYLNGTEIPVTHIANNQGDVSNSGNLQIAMRNSGYMTGTINYIRLYNKALSQSDVIKLYNNNLPYLVDLPYADRNANNTSLITGDNSTFDTDTGWWIKQGNCAIQNGKAEFIGTETGKLLKSNVLSIGKRYLIKYTISDYSGSQNCGVEYGRFIEESGTFRPVGNGDYTAIGIAISTTLDFFKRAENNYKLDNVEVYPIGCIAEYKAENAGSMGWLESQNQLHAIGYGNPLAPIGLRDYKPGISTTAVQFVNSQKAQTILKQIIVKNNYSGANTVSLGTTTSANELLNAVALNNGETKVIDVNSYSATERSLYAKAGNSNVDITLIFEKIAR